MLRQREPVHPAVAHHEASNLRNSGPTATWRHPQVEQTAVNSQAVTAGREAPRRLEYLQSHRV